MSLTKIQLAIAKERLTIHFKRGKIDEETYQAELEKLQERTENEVEEDLRQKTQDKRQETIVSPSGAENSQSHSLSAQILIETLDAELAEIDAEKASLSNSLQGIPQTKNAKDVVDHILAKREEWKQKKDELLYVKKHGHLPDALTGSATNGEFVQDEFMKSLPDDKYELDRMMRNLKSNLSPSKWPARAAKAKTEAKRVELLQNIAHGKLKLDAIEQKLRGM
ncbi:hypothetical protein [Jiulongibacter sp. NS-SX5]|uniref:hypothetical protein n=1 Tax=Jiulongibacter sp. NS-SX5 TaxID=3463854 RepID=UPI0040592EF5